MENWIETHSSTLTQQALSEAIFSGRILYFEGLKPMAEAITELQQLLFAAFEPHTPESAHESLEADEYQRRFDKAQEEFRPVAASNGAFMRLWPRPVRACPILSAIE